MRLEERPDRSEARTGRTGAPRRAAARLIRLADSGACKVGITRTGTNRIRQMLRGDGELLERLQVANRWSAVVIEGTVLEDTRAQRVIIDRPWLHGRGEHWLPEGAPPRLREVAIEIEAETHPRCWNLTLPATMKHLRLERLRGRASSEPFDGDELSAIAETWARKRLTGIGNKSVAPRSSPEQWTRFEAALRSAPGTAHVAEVRAWLWLVDRRDGRFLVDRIADTTAQLPRFRRAR